MIKPLNFPITNQKNFFDQAAKYSIFCCVDVRNAFLSIALTERAQKAASIITPFGVFNTLRTPFGLKSSPSTFCRAMSFVVADLPFVSIYVDDLLIGASSPEEMVKHLCIVFECLNKYNLKIQLTKSKIFTNKLKILGVIFSKQGQTIDPEKIAAIKKLSHAHHIKGFTIIFRYASVY